MQNQRQPTYQEMMECGSNFPNQYENQMACPSNNYMYQHPRPPFRSSHSSSLQPHQYNRGPSLPPSHNYSPQMSSYQSCLKSSQSHFHSDEPHYLNQNDCLSQKNLWQHSSSNLNIHSPGRQMASHHIPVTSQAVPSVSHQQQFCPNDVWALQNSHPPQSRTSQNQNSSGTNQMTTSHPSDPLHSLQKMVLQESDKKRDFSQINTISKNIALQEPHYFSSSETPNPSSTYSTYFSLGQNNLCSSSNNIPTLNTSFSDQELKDVHHSLDDIIPGNFEDHIQPLNSESVVNTDVFDDITNPEASSILELNVNNSAILSNDMNSAISKNNKEGPSVSIHKAISNNHLNEAEQVDELVNLPGMNYFVDKKESKNNLLNVVSETKATANINKVDLSSNIVNDSSLNDSENMKGKISANNDFITNLKNCFSNSEANDEDKLSKLANVQNQTCNIEKIPTMNNSSFSIVNDSIKPQDLFCDTGISEDDLDNSFHCNNSLSKNKTPSERISDKININNDQPKIACFNHNSLEKQMPQKNELGALLKEPPNNDISLDVECKGNEYVEKMPSKTLDSYHEKNIHLKLVTCENSFYNKPFLFEEHTLSSQEKVNELISLENTDKINEKKHSKVDLIDDDYDAKMDIKGSKNENNVQVSSLELKTTNILSNDKISNEGFYIENSDRSTNYHEKIDFQKKPLKNNILNGENAPYSKEFTSKKETILNSIHDCKKNNHELNLLNIENIQHNGFGILKASTKSLTSLTNHTEFLDEEDAIENIQKKEKYLLVKAPLIKAAAEISLNSTYHNEKEFHPGEISLMTIGSENNVDSLKKFSQASCTVLETPSCDRTVIDNSKSSFKPHLHIVNEANTNTNTDYIEEEHALNKTKQNSTSLKKDSIIIDLLPKMGDNIDCKSSICEKSTNQSDSKSSNSKVSANMQQNFSSKVENETMISDSSNINTLSNDNTAKEGTKISHHHDPKKEPLVNLEDDDTITSAPSPKHDYLETSKVHRDELIAEDEVSLNNDAVLLKNQAVSNEKQKCDVDSLITTLETISCKKEPILEETSSQNTSRIKRNKKHKCRPLINKVVQKKISLNQKKSKRPKRDSKIESSPIQEQDMMPKSKKAMFSGPFVRVEGQKTKPIAFNIVNVAQKEKEELKEKATPKLESVAKSELKRKIGLAHSSTLSPHYDAFTKDKTWLCCFCHRGSHFQTLGDLYGPYYVNYIQTSPNKKESSLPNKPEPSPTQRVVRSKRKRSELVEEFFKSSKKYKQSGKTSRGVQTDDLVELHPSGEDTDSQSREAWLHEECATWTPGVYLAGQKIFGLEEALHAASSAVCGKCKQTGASLACTTRGCSEQYHYLCSRDKGCEMKEDNFSILCPKHKNTTSASSSTPVVKRPIKGRAIHRHFPSCTPPKRKSKKSSFSKS